MGLIDKIKSTFFYIDEDEDTVKKEVIKVEIPAPSKEIKKEVEELPKEEVKQDPVFFDEDDFENLSKTIEIKPKEEEEKKEPVIQKREPYKNENYRSLDIKPKETKKFTPTPVISPVYGVLDKNYHKEDIVHKNEEKVYKDSNGMTIDDLRNKAFGTLEDELENTMYGSNDLKSIKPDEIERKEVFDDLELEMKQTADAIDLLDKNYDDFDETSSDNYEPQHIDSIKEDKQQNIDSIKEEKKENTKDEDLFELIDSLLYEKGDK